MKLKSVLAALLAAALLVGPLAPAPAAAASASQGFLDIGDDTVAQAAETLRLLGIVSGDGNGYFHPANTLTRAEFCKIAVEVLGKGGEARAQMNRTIFLDVLPSHWARGYINLAASLPVGGTEEKHGDMLMVGGGDSRFHPNDAINYAEAVTVMLRLLGYGSQELSMGGSWYTGALATGDSIGLTDGVSLAWNSPITRGSTAILFENMLFTAKKGSKEPYLTSDLGGKIVENAVILSLDAVAKDGTVGAVMTTASQEPYKTDHAPFPTGTAGSKAQLVLDRNEWVVAIRPSAAGRARTVSIVSAEATYLTLAGGEQVAITPQTVAYARGEASTYAKEYLDIRPSTQGVLQYAASGKLEYLFLSATPVADTAMVAQASGGNPFAALVGKDSYRVVKNGLSASLSDIRQYDVGTYDKTTKTLYVSDLRLTGVYTNVSPSPVTPLKVNVLGADFTVLPSAFEDLAKFKLGDAITLLFTVDSQVAGAVAPSQARSNAVGVAKIEDEKVTVTPLADLRNAKNERVVLTGETDFKKRVDDEGEDYTYEYRVAQLQGQLVTVSSLRAGVLSLSRFSSVGTSGALDLNTRTLDGAPLAENVRMFERVGRSVPRAISMANLTRATIPGASISYVGKDYAGRVSVIVFDDVTGDIYSYGTATMTTVTGKKDTKNNAVQVSGGKETVGPYITGTSDIKEGSMIGIVPSAEEISSTPRLAGWVGLKAVTKVPRSAFAVDRDAQAVGEGVVATPIGTVTTGGMILPIAGNVVCYNSFTKTWFSSLNEARAYSDQLTIYYDKAPQEGGKVRVVVVE